MAINILDLPTSQISNGLEGKTFLFYGTNGTGKTKQASKFPKPLYLAFENGINCIGGITFTPIRKFSDFVSIVKQLTNEKTLDKVKERYQTIIVDTLEAAGDLCADFVCEKYDVERIGDGNNGYGLWKEYAAEWNKWLRLLTSVGYTLVFIAHEGTRKFKDEAGEEYFKIYPKGESRIVDPVCDLVDVVGYAAVNDNDEDGNEVKSSLFMKQSKKFHARSRLDYMPPMIEEFTVANLTNAVKEAVEKQIKADGVAEVTYEEQQKAYKENTVPAYDDLYKEIGVIAKQLKNDNRMDEYVDIVESYLGRGKRIKDTNKSQTQMLVCILEDLKGLI